MPSEGELLCFFLMCSKSAIIFCCDCVQLILTLTGNGLVGDEVSQHCSHFTKEGFLSRDIERAIHHLAVTSGGGGII